MPQILRTKLYIPEPRPDLVARPHLLQRLQEGLRLGHKLSLISAPAGFGKTTLLSEWVNDLRFTNGEAPFPDDVRGDTIEERPIENRKSKIVNHIAWLSLDENDNDLPRFLRYLSAAFSRVVPDLAIPPIGGTSPSFEAVLVPLINQLASLTTPVVLVLDDYHVIVNAAIDEALTFLIDNAPPTLNLVIATRADPSLPLPRWRARRQLLEIRAEDLRFTPTETSEFLQSALQVTLSDHDLDMLNTGAEGWIAALQLVAISLRNQEDVSAFVKGFSGSHRYIFDYLIDEVLQQQPPALRSFLLRTAILDRLTPSLCDAILGEPEVPAQQHLVQLERDNLFVVPLDNERRWYRYHHLFHDFLNARLAIEQPDLVPVLHRRAAQWYAAADMMDNAIPHALAAPDYDQAAALIAQAYPAILQRGEVTMLKQWVETLPTALRRNDPALMLAHAWTRIVTLDVEDMKGCLKELQRLVETKPDISTEDRAAALGEIFTIRASRAFAMGDMAGTSIYAERALAQLPEDNGVLRSVVAQNLGNAYSFLGKMEAASAAYTQAITEGRRSGNYFLAFSAMVNLGELHRLHGRWREAESLYQEGMAWLKAHQAEPLTGLMHAGLGLVTWDRWDITAARRHLEMGVASSRRIGAHVIVAMASSALACIAAYQEKHKEALDWTENTVMISRRLDYTEMVGFADLWEAQCHIILGDRAALARWLSHRQPLQHLSSDLRALETQVVAHARLLLGDARGALDNLASVRETVESAGWMQRLVEILVLEAQAYEVLGERPQALTHLETALDLSQPEAFIRPFVLAGKALLPLLQRIAKSSTPGALFTFIETILTALDAPLGAPSVASNLVEPLTERELEVLRLLPLELSTAEIAEKLVISYHTARTHLKHIYGKLGVHSRHEAVTRAERLNLL